MNKYFEHIYALVVRHQGFASATESNKQLSACNVVLNHSSCTLVIHACQHMCKQRPLAYFTTVPCVPKYIAGINIQYAVIADPYFTI